MVLLLRYQVLVLASYSGFRSTVVYPGNGVIQDLHLLKTTYQVSPMGNGIVTSIPSSSSSLILRLSFHSRLFWKWRYTGSAATWLLESQIYYNNQILNGDVLVVGIEI
ncbi:hypothetical protein ACFX12_000964 [Malus domestica]